MRNPLLAPELREALAEGRTEELATLLQEMHPNDAASILSGLDANELNTALALLPLQVERNIFEYLDADVQEDVILASGGDRVKALIAALSSDDRAAFMDRLDERVRDQVFPLLNKAVREDLIRREQFEEDQVGAILSTEYCALSTDLTVLKAIEEIRRQAPNKETVYYSYVVDADGRLQGLLSLRDLIVARSHQWVRDLMRTDCVKVDATAPSTEAARLIREYDLIALPVVDAEGRLIGIVTHDDAADIIAEEGAEDIELMAGITTADTSERYFDEPVLSHFRRRVPWVSALAVMFLVTAAVIHENEVALRSATLLAFLPMVMSTGGNVGAQTSTVVIRGLALGEFDPRALLRVLWKELRISSCLAAVLSAIVFVEVYYLGWNELDGNVLRMCFAVSLGLLVHVVSAAMLGATIPLTIAALRLDPALVANPALTTLADLSGALIYFVTIALVLG